MPNIEEAIETGVLGAVSTFYKGQRSNSNITITAIITDTSRKREGIYKVKSDGAEFDAYSENGTYYKNESVLVQIPNNDYTGQKFILGRKASDVEDEQVFKFKLPFDNFVGRMHLNKNQEISEKGFWANFPGQSEETADYLNDKALIWEWSNIYYEEDENGNQIKKILETIGNKKLGIQADWQTLLGSYQVSKGHYGLRIIVEGTSSSSEQGSDTKILREGLFTNNDMYGNPYSFYAPYTQQKVFDISDFLSISSIKIYFYQDYEFFDGNYKYIPYGDLSAEANEPVIPYNILCSNLDVFLGLGTDDIQDETGILYSYNALSYIGIEHTDSDGSKMWTCDEDHKLYFSWIHYESEESYEVIDNLEKLEEYREGKGRTHIYWYRYGYDTELEENPELQLFPGQIRKFDASGNLSYDKDGEPEWEFENPLYENLYKDLQDSKRNTAYESKIERYGGDNWTFIPAATDSFSFEMVPRGYKSKERFKVVIQHDGSHTTSNELAFQNTLDIEAELANNAKNSNVILKCYKLKKVRDDNGEWLGTYEAVEDNSINSFHVYDENNTILYNDDDERFDQHEYYLQIHVRNEETNKYELLTTVVDNSTTTGTTVSWACPRQLSMIKYSAMVDRTDAEYFGIGETEDIRYQNFQNATLKFKIDSVLNNRYLDNTIGATIIRNNIPTYISKELLFGRAEGLGHDYLPVIEILSPYGSPCIYYGQEFQIGCVVYKKDGTLFETPSLLNFSWRILSGDPELDQASEFYHYDSEGNYLSGYEIGNYVSEIAEGDIYKEKYAKYSNNVLKGILTNKYPPIVEVTVQNAADYPLVVRKGLMVYYDYDGGDWDYIRKRDFMIPNRVEFKSDGMTPIYYNDYFETAVLSTEDGATTNTYEIEHPDWKINNSKLFTLEKTQVDREINTGSTIEDWSYLKYKMVPNTARHEEDFNDFSMQWSEDLLSPDNYTYIYYGDDDQHIVAQAISFDRNLYSSSLVNSWDGTTLTWDEENGAILSTMIAAGSKDSYNRFTGVMMGDWHAKGDESLDTPGLYGYNGGAQTFGFKTDGTGFIGGSGKGRIEFDGTEALISNADRSCYINLNPVNYKLDEFNLENQSFSQNFIYCRVNKTSANPDNFDDLSNGILGDNSWAQQYFKQRNDQGELVDTPYDYFIVDPNHGVLTTGGVVARYGAIGNWMISDQGLYQRDTEQNKYMYLGFKPQGETSTYAIYAGTDFNNNNGVAENPYFSVSWDGELFARKGKISNTWTIDDVGLTYEKEKNDLTNYKIFDRIYMGNPTSNTAIVQGDNSSDKQRWSISAGENKIYTNGSQDNYINFGVSMNGELFAKLGTIGNWTISDKKLESVRYGVDEQGNKVITSAISLDTEENKISFLNDSTVIYGDGRIFLGKITGNTAVGTVYLANYALLGMTTSNEISGLSNKLDTNDANTQAKENHKSESSGYGSVGYDSVTIQASGGTSTLSGFSIYNPSLFKILDNGSTVADKETGIVLATGSGKSKEDTSERALVIYPTGYAVDKKYATLGTSTNRWNLMGECIDCTSLDVSNLNVRQDALYINNEKAATQPWVYNKLNEVYNALNSVSSGSGSGISGAFGGINGLSLELQELFDGKAFMSGTNFTFKDGVISYSINGWAYNWTAAKDGSGGGGSVGGATFESSSSWKVADIHHTHVLDMTFTENGTVEVVMGPGSFNGTALYTVTSTNSVEDTAWYKKRAYDHMSGSGGSGGAVGGVTAYAIDGTAFNTFNFSLTLSGSESEASIVSTSGTGASYSLASFYANAYNTGHGVGYEEGYGVGHSVGYTAGVEAAACSEKHEGDTQGDKILAWIPYK